MMKTFSMMRYMLIKKEERQQLMSLSSFLNISFYNNTITALKRSLAKTLSRIPTRINITKQRARDHFLIGV